jgi:RNA polymerase sigma-70 factor (ECF subfamily)
MTETALEDLTQERDRYVAFVQRRVGSRELAEDIVQQAFVKSLERGSGLRREESIVAWFYRVLRNAVIDHYRRSDASSRALAQWAGDLARNQSPDAQTQAEICQCLLSGLRALKHAYRRVLELADMDGRPLADLAAEAGITETNAAVRLHRARKALRRRLHDCCAGCADCTCQTPGPDG